MGIVFIDPSCNKTEKLRTKVRRVIKPYFFIEFRFVKCNNAIISI